MRSATSCSKTLIRSDWRRFWPVTFLYAFVSFFIMPVGIWNEGSTRYIVDYTMFQEQAHRTYQTAAHVYGTLPAFTVINLFLGVGLAMVLFGYLMKSNSVGLMHALPVTRTRQFLTHFAAGFSMLTAANLLTFGLSLLVEALAGTVDAAPLLIWLLVTELTGFFFLAFGALCAMATGWLLAVPVIYFGLNFVASAYWAILNGMAEILWTNHSMDNAPGGLVMWLTPVVKLIRGLQIDERDHFGALYQNGATLFTANHEALPVLLIYTLAGVLMLALAWVLYRARHSETAGDAIVFPWLRPVVRYVISIAAGLALGMFIYAIIFGGGRNMLGLLLCQIIMGTLVYCAVEMLLRKSYKIFDRRTLLGLAALWLALIAVFVCVRQDITGYQRRVPEAEQVAKVDVFCGGNNTESNDPDVVDAVTELHRALTRQGPFDEEEAVYLSIRYELRNGEWMSRNYYANLANPAVYRSMSVLLNLPELAANRLIPDHGAFGERFVGGYVESYALSGENELTAEQALALYRALETDSDKPLVPEDLYRYDFLPVHLELVTEKGSYSIDSIPTNSASTIALLKEYGVTIAEDDLKYGR